MPIKAWCCCPRHDDWGHRQDALLRIATEKEKRFCGISDGRHADRKRKICQFCRNRIAFESVHENRRPYDDQQSESSAPLVCQEPIQCYDDQQSESSAPLVCQEPRFQCYDDQQSESSAPLVCQEPIQDPDSLNRALNSKGTQSGESYTSRLPYQEYELRKKSDIRSEAISNIHQMLISYVHGDESAMRDLLKDILHSKKFKSTFGNIDFSGNTCNDKFLHALVNEYKACKNKEENLSIQTKAKELQQPIKISDTKGKSHIAFQGVTPEHFSSRVQAAKDMGRVSTYCAERRRLLSIVAFDYSQKFLAELFGCSKNTVTAARVHCVLFGRGGVPPPTLKFTRQRVSQDVLDGLSEFLLRDNVSRPSSCRSVVINKEECPVRYWQDSIKALIQQYRLEFPNGVKRTYIYAHIPKNFRQNTMLAGLCNLCEDFGYSNFENLIGTVKKLPPETVQEDVNNIVHEIRHLQRFLKSKFSNQAERHSSCLELCMNHAIDSCDLQHPDQSLEFSSVYTIYNKIDAAINRLPAPAREEYLKEMDNFKKNFSEYVGHIIRTKHQSEYYRYVLDHLKCGEAVVIIDYKMKLELCKHSREIQRDWYGKRGISIHGFYVIAKLANGDKKIDVLDLWSDDTKQDAWFTQNALDIGFKWMEKALPNFNVYLFSDNGPHYHNTAVLLYLAEVNKAFDINLIEYNNFEAGEGKTVLDTHFAHISHKIIRWVRVGNNLDTGEQLAELLQSMKNVRCNKLIIDRSKAPSKIGTLKDISLFGNFKFPTTGPHASGIVLQSLAGAGKVLKKTAAQLQALSSRSIPVASNTGASISDDCWQASDAQARQSSGSESYSVCFIQQPTHTHTTIPTHLIPLTDTHHHVMKPLAGFVVKKGGAKRVTFTEEQKSIMIYYYDRQKTEQIRADPKDVIAQMRLKGIPELKESQIKSWWGTYRKQKQLAEDMVLQAQELKHQDGSTLEGEPESETEPEMLAAPELDIPTAATGPQIPVNPSDSPQPLQLTGCHSSHTPQVIEWTFSESQSNIGGRQGSNACCFVALYMGKLIHTLNLVWPTGNILPLEWKDALRTAMLTGNAIHDDLFDFSAVNVQVDDAVAMAGDECMVDNVTDQMDIFGHGPVIQLKDCITRVVNDGPLPSYSVLSAHGLTVLLAVNTNKSAMIIDSHSHGASGAIIAFCEPVNVSNLGCWFAAMLKDNFNTCLTIASLSIIRYLRNS